MAASVTFQATDTDGGSISGGSSYTFTMTVSAAAGQERLVIVGGIGGAVTGVDFTAVTIDGQTATRVGTVSKGADDGGNVCAFLTCYRAPGTSGTNINVVATAASGPTIFGGYCALWTLTDADTLLASTNAAVNDPALNTNTVAAGIAVAALLAYSNGGGPTVAWAGLTEAFDAVRVFGDEVFSGASSNIASGSSPLAISADITPDLTASIASICVSFNAVATSTGFNPPTAGFALGIDGPTNATSRRWNHEISDARVYQRALNVAELSELANPRQGAVAWNAALAATEAADVANLAGLVARTGALAATDSADTAALTGLVGRNGILAVAEAADAASFPNARVCVECGARRH